MPTTTTRPPQLTGAASALFDAMSAVSEAAYNVRWAPGTEYGVWTLLTVPRSRWGRARADHSDVASALATLRELALQSGLWVIWPTTIAAPLAMSLDHWRVRYLHASPAERSVA